MLRKTPGGTVVPEPLDPVKIEPPLMPVEHQDVDDLDRRYLVEMRQYRLLGMAGPSADQQQRPGIPGLQAGLELILAVRNALRVPDGVTAGRHLSVVEQQGSQAAIVGEHP